MKVAHFVVIHLQTWPPQTILFSDWSICKKNFPSETTFPNKSKFRRKNLWMVLNTDCSSCPDPVTTMAATGNSCF